MNATTTASSRPVQNRLDGLPPQALSALREIAAQLAKGDLKAAERALLVADFHAPANAEVQRQAGMVYHRQGRLRESAASYAKALAARPGDATVLTQLGAVQADFLDAGAAIASLHMAATLAADAPTWRNLGIEFERQGYSSDALVAADNALALSPNDGVAMLLRAQSRQAVGDAAGAAADYRALIARDEFVAKAWFALLDIKTVRIDANELLALERFAAKPALDDEERMLLAFALGRAYEDADRHGDAFAAFVRGNARVRELSRWNKAVFSRHIDDVRAAFEAPHASAAPGLGSEIIFLVGLPRSGTTLIEQVLAAHPRVEGASELPYLNMVIFNETTRRKKPFPQWVADATPDDWTRMGHNYLNMSARWRLAKPMSTDKLPENWVQAGAALAMLPGARVIDCRRDPVETCWSCFKLLFAPGRVGFAYDLDSLAAYWHDYDRLCRFWVAQYPAQFRRQSYEEFLADPEGQTRALLQFCDLDFDAACLNYREAKRGIRTASAAQVRQPLRHDTARSGRYGELLAPLRAMLEGKP
jgi:Tfp pilus assembly protein PilF